MPLGIDCMWLEVGRVRLELDCINLHAHSRPLRLASALADRSLSWPCYIWIHVSARERDTRPSRPSSNSKMADSEPFCYCSMGAKETFLISRTVVTLGRRGRTAVLLSNRKVLIGRWPSIVRDLFAF